MNPDPSSIGEWEPIRYRFSHLPIHMALLHTGKVLAFGGSGNDELSLENPYPAEIFDLRTGNVREVPQELGGDLFCAGHSFLADGTLLAAGGTYKYEGNLFGLPIPPFRGLDQSYVFNPSTERWTRKEDMAKGRWYPTLVTLGDGRIVAVSGLTRRFPWMFPRQIEIYSQDLGWDAGGLSLLERLAQLLSWAEGVLADLGAQFVTTEGASITDSG